MVKSSIKSVFVLFLFLFLRIDTHLFELETAVFDTRIFEAYGPIMFALRVGVGFGASWRGGILSESCSFVNSSALGYHKYV